MNSTKPDGDCERARDHEAFDALRSYIGRLSLATVRGGRLFHLCVRASLSRSYEFNRLVRDDAKIGDAYFWLPSLRGICEDLIVLNFIKKLPKADREELIDLLMRHDVLDRSEKQSTFFGKARPQQRVLRLKDAEKIRDDELEPQIRAIWNRHGWPKMRKHSMPQTKQLAEQQGEPVLLSLYEYLYRLTSGTVHFSVYGLLRMGWGADPRHVRFSTEHFGGYHVRFARVYGAYLFCLYFEFFGRLLRPRGADAEAITTIKRELLMAPLWPEMVTFEELNRERPAMNVFDVAYTAMQAERAQSLLSPHELD